MNEVIDIHTHVVPEKFPPYAGKGKDVPWPSMADADACHKHVMISGKLYRTVSDGSWSVPRRIEEMGAMGVTRQAISPMPELLSYWLPLDDAKAMIRYLNEVIAEMIAAAPERFVGLGCVPLQDTDAAIRELEYLMKDLKCAGVEIASHVNGVSIGDARFEPFFAAAERLNAAIFVHALRPAGQERIVGAFPEQAVCFPGDVALACASMITGGIATRHPKLRIAFSHGGGTMSILMPRLLHAWNMFPKAKESLAGYWIVDVPEERALEISSRIVAFIEGPIEVRQIADAPPESSTTSRSPRWRFSSASRSARASTASRW